MRPLAKSSCAPIGRLRSSFLYPALHVRLDGRYNSLYALPLIPSTLDGSDAEQIMTKLVTLERHGRIGVLRIANPPVNALSDAVVAQLKTAIEEFRADRSYEALLLHCDGRTFIAGADITVFDNDN